MSVHFAPLERGEIFGLRMFNKHFVPMGRARGSRHKLKGHYRSGLFYWEFWLRR